MRQLALLDVSILVGDVLGSLIGPVVYVKFGYNYVFGLSAFSCALALMYLYFFIPESVKDTSRVSLHRSQYSSYNEYSIESRSYFHRHL